jgi:hypothetical protein
MDSHNNISNSLSTDSWENWCDASYWSDTSPFPNMQFSSGNIVFCKIDAILSFFERLRLTRRKIILVSGQGDLPCDAFRQSFMPENVYHWFATNVTFPNKRVTSLPLGLGSPNSPTTLTEKQILDAKNSGIASEAWLYVNFRADTNPAERRLPYEYFKKISKTSSWVTFETPSERGVNNDYLRQLVRHRFVLCPPGNGIDTHRMWEALLAGVTPVVKRSPAMEPFSKLPIIFVDDFREISLDLLEKAHLEIKMSVGPHLMMSESYWAELIKTKQSAIRNAGMLNWGRWITESAKYGVEMVNRRLGISGGTK